MKDFIVKLRKSAGLSQEELAQKLGFSRPTLVAIEKGERDINLTELRKISEIFDLPMEIILDEELSVSKKVDLQNFGEKSFAKFHNLILQCIKYGSDVDGKITKTKLAKLVYLSDFASYYNYLKAISGFEYRRFERGPVAIEFFDIIDNDESVGVEKNGDAVLISLIEQPNDAVLDKKELELVKAICKKWKNANTQEIVDFTHKQFPWSMCKDREVIPYTLINMESPENVY
ncbi:MAG: helix-turn-helix domain-containing protein [Candidatus Peregrinibacteria bacterium]|nr:helix-turn-helix domain-containing protein [Candidatus Peregrinibacteria bacterium]